MSLPAPISARSAMLLAPLLACRHFHHHPPARSIFAAIPPIYADAIFFLFVLCA